MAEKKSNAGRKMFDGKDIEKVVSKLEEGFIMGLNDREASLYADISLAAFNRYCDKNPKFRDRKEILKEQPKILAKRNIFHALQQPENTNDSKWLLEHRASNEYSKQSKTDITTQGEKVEAITNVHILSEQELDEALQARLSQNSKGE